MGERVTTSQWVVLCNFGQILFQVHFQHRYLYFLTINEELISFTLLIFRDTQDARKLWDGFYKSVKTISRSGLKTKQTKTIHRLIRNIQLTTGLQRNLIFLGACLFAG